MWRAEREKSEDERERQLLIQCGFDRERIYTAAKVFFYLLCDNSCELFNEQIYIFLNNLHLSLPLLLIVLLLLEAAANLGAGFV